MDKSKSCRPFGNLDIGMSASASTLASALTSTSAFEYKDYILHSMNRL